MQRENLRRAPAEVTFNIVYVPGSVRRLLPFALTLLMGSGVRIRVVSNGCGADEIELLHAASHREDRISVHVLPFASSVDHGTALNHLFTSFDEPIFAFADSDVLASGDFVDDLFHTSPRAAAVFAAPAVFHTDDEAVLPAGATYLAGRHMVLSDGTPSGGTYIAAYERRLVEQVWQRAPRGFKAHRRSLLDRRLKRQFSSRGWSFHVFDTGRVINLLLLLDGHRLENRNVPALHHIGGLSVRELGSAFSSMRLMMRQLRARDDHVFQRMIDGAFRRLYVRSSRSPAPSRERRRIVCAHVDEVLDAIDAGRPVPATPPTGSEEVDRRLSELVAALVESYPAGLNAVGGYRPSP